MAWNPANQRVDLLIENHGTAKKPKYRLHSMVRRTTPDGKSYLEPVPMAWGIRDQVFDCICIVSPHSTKRDDGAGELSLTGTSGTAVFGGRKP